jgi:RHS repeat-associated protein
MKLQYSYVNGILNQISDVTTGVHYWTANTVNPRGQLTQETLGNGVVVNHAFDAVTGWVGTIQAGVGGGSTLQSNAYLFDEVGNLSQRQDFNSGVTESVYPDNLNRLSHTVGDTNTQMTYDSMGRISSWAWDGGSASMKDYTTPQTGCTYYPDHPQPHAVRSTTFGSNAQGFCYDANGNVTLVTYPGVSSVNMVWTSFNQPNDISNAANSSQFYYDADHQRYKQLASYGGVVENTIYAGGLLEKMSNSSGTAYRHYISAGYNTIVYTRSSSGTNSTYYLTGDHLGSSAVITDQTGTSLVKETFAALGWNENSTADQNIIAGVTRHGFTGQEGLETFNFVDMNGRVYVPYGGMFLSADPYISDPGNTQNYNRYGYVYNNPLTNTDPTGYFSLGNLLNPFSNSNPLNPFGSFGRKLALAPFTTLYDSYRFASRTSDNLLRDEKWLQPLSEIAACYYGGPWACAAASAKLTRLNGGTMDQALIAGVTSFAQGYVTPYVNSLPDWANIPIDGVISGGVAAANGGSFRTGFYYGAGAEAAYDIYAGTGGVNHAGQPNQPTFDSGGPAVSKDPTSPDFNAGAQEDNNFGTQTTTPFAQNGQWFPVTEGSVISNFCNAIPGCNSIATLHDNWNSPVAGFWSYPTMIPAFIVNAAALSGTLPLCAVGRGGPCR